jgi:predicted Zn-dependent protease
MEFTMHPSQSAPHQLAVSAGKLIDRSRLCIVILQCITLFGGLTIMGCGVPSDQEGDGEGPGSRAQTLALSPKQELQLGRKEYQDVLNNPEEYGRVLPQDGPECKRARGVAERIVKASEIEPLQREIKLRKGYRFEWEVNVLDNRQANAFCLPGGKIAVFVGILRVAEDDAQLATVISHEISHALAHHTSERVARRQKSGLGGGIWEKAFDRSQESEADHIGLFLMTFANYDPDEAVHFWEKMQQLSAGHQSLPEFLSDHPSDAHRVQQMKEWLPNAVAAKKAYDEGRVAPASGR